MLAPTATAASRALVAVGDTGVGAPLLTGDDTAALQATVRSLAATVDRLAAAAGRDPVDFRRSLLQAHPRHLGVLELAAEKAASAAPEAGGDSGIAPEEFPHLMRAMEESQYLGWDEMFDRGLRALVRGLIVERLPVEASEGVRGGEV